MTFREYFKLKENKDHLIDKLDLTDEQKDQLKAFFKKYPNYESKIDWNRKDLTFDDFKELLANEGKSKSQAKKKGLEGITEGVDYKILDQKEDYIAYQPLTYLGSVTIASNKVPPVKENGAQWCTAYQKTDQYWNSYTKKGIRFCYICDSEMKYALVLYPDLKKKECFSFEDSRIKCPEKYEYLYEGLMTEEERKFLKDREKVIENYVNNYLPSLWIEKKVAYIPPDCNYRNEITNITIPDSVMRIRFLAFHDCMNLENITIPNSVTSIERDAFSGCINLTNIMIPDSVTSIERGAFWACKGLKSITLPDSVTDIEDSVFYNCENLTSITIPNSVKSIGDYMFANCRSLTSVVIPDSVRSIGDCAFYECESLANIIIPDSVTSINDAAFCGCINLTNITIPNSLTSIGGRAFIGCKSLASITIPDSVKSIGDFAFRDCVSLINITIPDSVTSIGEVAFGGCTGLTNISIPDSVTSIRYNAFWGCKNLTIYYQGTKDQWKKIKGSERIEQPVVFNSSKLNESKDHLINRLDLTDDQKKDLISFFKKYPNFESKIDWNRKDLEWGDFEPLLTSEGKSKSQAKKKGLEGITEGKDYIVIDKGSDYIAYQPLTYLGSVTIASNKVPPVKENGAKWCIAYQKTDQYWKDYTGRGIRFIYVCTNDTKYALVKYLDGTEVCFSFEDESIRCPDEFEYLFDEFSVKDILQLCLSLNLLKETEKGYSCLDKEACINIPLGLFVEDGKFTVQFDEWVGDFNCNLLNLTSLEGSPQKVGGNFNCSFNKLTSLKGSPREVIGNFSCANNYIASLEGGPEVVYGDYRCGRNKITSLNGLPKVSNGSLNLQNNPLTSLKGCPAKISGNFSCSDCSLTSLEGGPRVVHGNYFCANNKLTSLKGAPVHVYEDFYCENNQLESLEGEPLIVEGMSSYLGNPVTILR